MATAERVCAAGIIAQRCDEVFKIENVARSTTSEVGDDVRCIRRRIRVWPIGIATGTAGEAICQATTTRDPCEGIVAIATICYATTAAGQVKLVCTKAAINLALRIFDVIVAAIAMKDIASAALAIDRVRPFTAEHSVVTGPGINRVIAAFGIDRIVAAIAVEPVAAFAASQCIIASTATDHPAIAVVAKVQGIVAASSVKGVISRPAIDLVIAAFAVNHITAAIAGNGVVIVRADQAVARIAIVDRDASPIGRPVLDQVGAGQCCRIYGLQPQ